MRRGPRDTESGELVELRGLSRPFAWIYALFSALFFLWLASEYNYQTLYLVFSGWLAFASVLMFLRTPNAIAVHENGLVVSYLRRDVYYPWTEAVTSWLLTDQDRQRSLFTLALPSAK